MDECIPKYRPNLKSVYIKLERAKHHFEELNSIVEKILKDGPHGPYAVSGYDDIENGLYVCRLELKPITPLMPILVGEIAYHLRSALDHIVWQLCLLKTSSPDWDMAFPVYEKSTEISKKWFRKRVGNFPEGAIEIIESLQPYHRGTDFKGHPLWRLNKLCNTDKHRLLAVGGTTVGITCTAAGPTVPRQWDTELGKEIGVPLAEKGDFKLKIHPPFMELGEPIDAVSGDAFSFPFMEFSDIYNFIAQDVIPRFLKFLAFE